METLQWEASCSMQMDGKTDSHTKLKVTLLQFFKVPALKYKVMQEIKL